MQKNQKITLGISLTILLGLSVGIGIILSNPPSWLTRQIVNTAARSQRSYPDIDQGLHVMLLGTGSPMSDPDRVGPSNLVIAGDKHFIVDSGSGSTRNLLLSGISPGLIDAVFLTHFHSDHIADLGELMLQRWATEGNSAPLHIYGPPGVTSVVDGFNDAFELDATYRTAHHGEENVSINGSGGIAYPILISNDTMAGMEIFNEAGIVITMFNVNHYPVEPAVGYKFEYKGRSVVISGDSVYSENLEAQSANADLLICEALNAEVVQMINEATSEGGSSISNGEIILTDIQDYHMSPEDAATTAKNANVEFLVYTHMIPPLPESQIAERLFIGDAAKIFDGEIAIGYDGFFISMPKYSEVIITTNLLKDVAQFPPVVIIVISLLMLILMFVVGRKISKKKELKAPILITVVAVVMSLLLLTRISEFIHAGFNGRTAFNFLVEAVILIWSILILKKTRKIPQAEKKVDKTKEPIQT
ncbi:Ribonuclease BN [Candidatus Lokiarchaeum ossiferum]|uniref:Ribonuclease BN n=1 Tax=Candidatus Lokiarchaeum ossiferum TaxID=2951803 RepID=A0ABY6HNQ4_9ARCH|nr:Ribonuclease BN [Candidatus Lokiarchaeum sp. B-35]